VLAAASLYRAHPIAAKLGVARAIDRERILEILEDYDLDDVRIATIGSHSALDLCDGAVEEGFRTLVVCERAREAPYTRYLKATRGKDGRLMKGVVDDAIVLDKFEHATHEKTMRALRDRNAIFVPNRSLTSYCGVDAVEEDFLVPLFGSRQLLRTEERTERRSYYWLLEKAKLPFPEKIDDPADIDGLVIVKLPHKAKKLERGFFTAASPKEYREKSGALLKSGVIDRKDLAAARIEKYILGPVFNFDFFYSPLQGVGERLELLGVDWRFETSLDGHVRLPADQQLTLPDHERIPEYTVVGHNSATLRESSLSAVYDMAERYVRATREHHPPGIIGPFTLQTCVDKDLKFWIYDVAPRIGGGTNVHLSVGHPYGNALWRRTMSTGRRVAVEIRHAIESGKLGTVVT
jgi:5-formaminoimidazole-4-carboxamide-1-(beta)-D-ribofuranosyl 5'-monophosphate synthetase